MGVGAGDVNGLLRRDDDIPVRRLLTRAVTDVRERFGSGDADGIAGILDRLTCLAVTFLELGCQDLFQHVVDALVSIYGVGFEGQDPITNKPPRMSAMLWLAIIERVLALGSMATRLNNWPAARYLAAQRNSSMYSYYTTWLWHAMTMAAVIMSRTLSTPCWAAPATTFVAWSVLGAILTPFRARAGRVLPYCSQTRAAASAGTLKQVRPLTHIPAGQGP